MNLNLPPAELEKCGAVAAGVGVTPVAEPPCNGILCGHSPGLARPKAENSPCLFCAGFSVGFGFFKDGLKWADSDLSRNSHHCL